MPLVTISGPALSVEKKRDLAQRITEVMSDIYRHPAAHIIITIHENPPENVSVGGKLVADR